MEMILLNDKSKMQIRAKEINSKSMLKTLNLLLFCAFIYILLSNIKQLLLLIASFAPRQIFNIATNIYFNLAVSFLMIFVSVIVLARLKAVKEICFILKSRAYGEKKITYTEVKKEVKKVGIKCYTSLYIRLWVLNKFWFIVLLAPCAVVIWFSYSSLCQSSLTKTLVIIIALSVAVLFAIGFITFLCVRQRYSLCYWIASQENSFSASETIKQSAKIMDKNCVDLFLFKLRFIAWILLAIVIFPTIVYVYPYYKQACAIYAFEILSAKNKWEEKTLTFERLKQ
jgi:uncharacterized membrane protein